TDKITMEIEAESTGVLLKTLYEPGDTVPVQQVIAYIGEKGEEINETDDLETAIVSRESNANDIQEQGEKQNQSTDLELAINQPESQSGKVRRTPIACKIANENNISLTNITGTGP